jgi:hypothetical protein
MTTRIALDSEAFRKLVAGEVVRETGVDGVAVEIMLSDLGFAKMREILDAEELRAIAEAERAAAERLAREE